MAQTKPRILYVDEEAEDGFTLTTLLRLAGYEPVTTNYASDALQLARSDDFDLCVLGRRFPADSGAYLCQKLHEIAPQTPIIFLPDDYVAAHKQPIRSCPEEHVVGSTDAREILEAVGRVLSTRQSAVRTFSLPSIAFSPDFFRTAVNAPEL